MKRICIDKEIEAKTIKKATEKFAKVLTEKGYEWAADEMIESVENGYLCCSNAAQHNLIAGRVTTPITTDWTYYWGVEKVDENLWYTWFIERT